MFTGTGYPIVKIRWSWDHLISTLEFPGPSFQQTGLEKFPWFFNDIPWINSQIQWNLYKVTTKFCGLSRQVVFHDRENKHDFVKTAPGKWWNLCVFSKTSPVSLYRFHCTCSSLTHWGRDKNGHHFPDDIFKCIFLSEKYEFRLRFHCSLYLRAN